MQSHEGMSTYKQIRSVIITGPGFQDEEYVYPYYRLLEAGHKLDVAIKDQVQVLGKYGVPARPTMPTAHLRAENYDLVLLPGGFEAPDRVRLDKTVLQFLRDMNEDGKCIAAICHGPWILVSAGILKGRKVTGFESIRVDLENAGAEYVDAPLVIDGNLISAPHYRNNPEFMKATVEYFESR
jgi:protease I